MFPYLVEKLLIGITFVAADVYDKRAAVGDDIVLRSGICHGDTHLYRAQEGRFFREAVVAKPRNVVQYLIYGIVSFITGGVPRTSVGSDIQHH